MAGQQRGRKRLHDGVAVVTAFRAGEPRIQGRFERPEDGFVLRAGLGRRGKVAFEKALEEVRRDWQRQVAQGTVLPQTVASHVKVLNTFKNFMMAQGVKQVADIDSDLLVTWLHAISVRTGESPTTNMVVQRRAVARTIYATWALLGITDHDITATLAPIRRPQRALGALSAEDVETLKDHADASRHIGEAPTGSTKGPAAIALALLGAQTPEIPEIRVCDIHLLDQRVWVHGGSDRYRERWVAIDDSWAFEALAARAAFLLNTHGACAQQMRVAYDVGTKRGGTSPDNPAAAVCNIIDKTMKASGLKQRKKVRVASITEYVAIREWESSGRVEAVAARLGMSSLDRAAHIVGYDWRDTYAIGKGE